MLELFYLLIILLVIAFLVQVLLLKKPNLFYRDIPAGLCVADLPNKPNWVSSLVPSSNAHYIAPLPTASLIHTADVIQLIDPKTYTVIVSGTLQGFRRTPFWGFTDWFCIGEDGHVTSSATLGYSDLGKNREWVNHLRQRLTNGFPKN